LSKRHLLFILTFQTQMRRKEKRSYGKEPKRNWMNGIAIMRSKLLRQKQQIGIVIFFVNSEYLCVTPLQEKWHKSV